MALLDVILGYDCNLACDYCTITPEMRTRALGSGQVLAALRRGRELGYETASFTGGEPTIRPDLIALIRAARELGYRDIKLQTNGLVFAELANVDRAIEAGVSRFHVSIHTHEAAAYERLVQRPDTHRLMERALVNLVERRVRLAADVILKSDTYRKLPAAAEWLAEREVRAMDLWFVSLTDGNRENVESMPRMTEVVPVLHEVFAWGDAHDMTIRSLHIPRCLLGADAHRAFDPGADRVMVVTPEATFELKHSKISPQRYVAACEGCAHRSVCPGVRHDYLERFGDAEIQAARRSPRS